MPVGPLESVSADAVMPAGSTTRTEAMPAEVDSAAALTVMTALTDPATAGSISTSVWAYATPATVRAATSPTTTATPTPEQPAHTVDPSVRGAARPHDRSASETG